MIRALLATFVGVLIATPALASGGGCDALPGTSLGDLSVLWVIPFAGLLLSIAIVPMVAGHWWHHNKNQLITAMGWAAPVLLYLVYLYFTDSGRLGCEAGMGLTHAVIEYVSFIALLGSLFIISGGILLKGDLQGKPGVNTAFLLIGAVISNVIGTTGASMLLIQPMLRTNAERKHTWHIPIFFIFLVSNIGGALTPIGDPPLFLGYLRGVDFFWTLTHLWWIWIPTVGFLLAVFYVLDTIMYRKESVREKAIDAANVEPLGLEGSINFLLLGGVIAAVLLLSPVGHSTPEEHGEGHASIEAPAEHGSADGFADAAWLSTSAMAAPETEAAATGEGEPAATGHGDAAGDAPADHAEGEHAEQAGMAHDEGAHDTDGGAHDAEGADHGAEGAEHAAEHEAGATEHHEDEAGHDGEHAAAAGAHGDSHDDAHDDGHGQSHAAAWSLDPRDYFLREIVMAALAGLSLWVTSQRIRERNKFEYGPILEVAALFIGIFVAMVPATAMLQANGDQLGLTEPWQFFWMTGALSAFLDNAPTYVTFASVACGIDPTCVSANDLSPLMGEHSMGILMAISLGAVFLGAGSYIGNGPNFMVRAIAENY